MDEVERAARVAALGRMVRRLVTVKRAKRSPIEAPELLTSSYIRLFAACAAAALGEVAAAETLIANAMKVFDRVRGDVVHDWLVDRLVATVRRDEAAIAALTAKLDELERQRRYKVDRMREVTVFLGNPVGIDALERVTRRRQKPPSPPTPVLPYVVLDDAIAAFTAGNVARGTEKIETFIVVSIPLAMTRDERLARASAIARAVQGADYTQAIAWTERVADAWWEQVSDSFGTNSHYCLAAVGISNAFIHGVTGLG